MTSSESNAVEHFVTLFDDKFLVLALCLHESLLAHCMPFHLWILCMDKAVEKHLEKLALSNVSLIAIADIEDEQLKQVKKERTPGEYCWTLTPFAPQIVFDRDSTVKRITYIDADLFFFASPRPFFAEFESSGKHVLITEHAYDPRYDKSKRSGRFCVQFLTFRRTDESKSVLAWWQARCLEWCFARVEDGKFGDQKYLDVWPDLFGKAVHILQQPEKTLAPWNVFYYERKNRGMIKPVFYHFHGLRLIGPCDLLLFSGYKVGTAAIRLYDTYIDQLAIAIQRIRTKGFTVATSPLPTGLLNRLRMFRRRLFGGEGRAVIPQEHCRKLKQEPVSF